MNDERRPDKLRGVTTEPAGCSFFPTVKADVDFENNHCHQEHQAQSHLDPLVKLVALTILDLIDAPGQDNDDHAHGEHKHVEHEGRPRAEKSVKAGIVDRLHGEENSRTCRKSEPEAVRSLANSRDMWNDKRSEVN